MKERDILTLRIHELASEKSGDEKDYLNKIEKLEENLQ